MITSVTAPINERSSDKEIRLCVTQLRSVANSVGRIEATVESAGTGVSVELHRTKPIPQNHAYDVTYYIQGVNLTTKSIGARFAVDASFSRVTGGASLDGTTTFVSRISGGEFFSLGVGSDDSIVLEVNDNSVSAYSWRCWVEFRGGPT